MGRKLLAIEETDDGEIEITITRDMIGRIVPNKKPEGIHPDAWMYSGAVISKYLTGHLQGIAASMGEGDSAFTLQWISQDADADENEIHLKVGLGDSVRKYSNIYTLSQHGSPTVDDDIISKSITQTTDVFTYHLLGAILGCLQLRDFHNSGALDIATRESSIAVFNCGVMERLRKINEEYTKLAEASKQMASSMSPSEETLKDVAAAGEALEGAEK